MQTDLQQERKKRDSRIRRNFGKWYWSLVFLFLPGILSAAADFKTGLSKGLGVGVLLSFCMCVFFLIEGIWNYRNGGNYGKDIIGLIVSAGAFALVTMLFTAFGLSAQQSIQHSTNIMEVYDA